MSNIASAAKKDKEINRKRNEIKQNETKPKQTRSIRYEQHEILASLKETDKARYPFPNERLVSIKKEGDEMVVTLEDIE